MALDDANRSLQCGECGHSAMIEVKRFIAVPNDEGEPVNSYVRADSPVFDGVQIVLGPDPDQLSQLKFDLADATFTDDGAKCQVELAYAGIADVHEEHEDLREMRQKLGRYRSH